MCEKLTEHGDLLNEAHYSLIVLRDTRQRLCFQSFSIGMAPQKPLLKSGPNEIKKMGLFRLWDKKRTTVL